MVQQFYYEDTIHYENVMRYIKQIAEMPHY